VDPETAARITALSEVFPNPFNPQCTIRFSLAQSEKVSLSIHDLRGRRVVSLLDGQLPAGEFEQIWDGLDHHGQSSSSGIYFLRLQAGEDLLSKKLILLR
ncbi:T9SS type A sorting domain-containing protein, partial [bacterium]|nr:T9SS type A sorting domain-containing protein [bacterium]